MAFEIIFLGFLSLAFSALYGLVYTRRSPGLWRTIVKAVPITALTLISVLTVAHSHLALCVALAFGALGDILLSRDGQGFFLAGLVAFLLGHLAYIVLLLDLGNGWAQFSAENWRIVAGFVLVGTAGIVVRRLLPHLGTLRVPVLIYVCVIMTMGWAALGLPADWPLALATVGALLFIASDIILAFEVFVPDNTQRLTRWAAPTLWFLYWGGQSGIVLAVLLI